MLSTSGLPIKIVIRKAPLERLGQEGWSPHQSNTIALTLDTHEFSLLLIRLNQFFGKKFKKLKIFSPGKILFVLSKTFFLKLKI